jgi:hypothetical protein
MEQTFIETYGLQEFVKPAVKCGLTDFLDEIPEESFGIESLAYSEFRKKWSNDAQNYFPKIDLSFLSMRSGLGFEIELYERRSQERNPKKDFWLVGFPRFALYSLGSPAFKIVIRDFSGRLYFLIEEPVLDRYSRGLSSSERKYYYEKLMKLLCGEPKISGKCPEKPEKLNPKLHHYYDLYGLDRGVKLSAPFSAVLPPHIRKSIRRALRLFDERQIFVISEITNLKVEKRPERDYYSSTLPFFRWLPWTRDPLVVAIPNDSTEGYLIGQFDETPLEKYVASEFATSLKSDETSEL